MEICSKIVYSVFSTPFLVQFFFSGKVVLSMRISDEMEVSTIAIDKTTILRLDDRIALPMKFDNFSRSTRQRNLPNSVLRVQSFVCLLLSLFVFFRFPRCTCRGCSTSQNHSRYKTISLKNCRFDEKFATKATFPSTHERLKGLSLKAYIKKKQKQKNTF